MSFWKCLALSVAVGIVFVVLCSVLFSIPWSGAAIKTFEVKTPVDKTFDAFYQGVITKCSPAIRKKDFEGEGLGRIFRGSFEAGLPERAIESYCVYVDVDPGKKLVLKCGNTGGWDGAYTYIFSPTADGGTRITWVNEGNAYVPAAFVSTWWARQRATESALKHMSGVAECVKAEIEAE